MQRVCPPMSNQLLFILKNLFQLGQETNFIKNNEKNRFSWTRNPKQNKEMKMSGSPPLGKDLQISDKYGQNYTLPNAKKTVHILS